MPICLRMTTEKRFYFMSSERSKRVLLKGHRYNLGNKNKNGTTWWRCKNRSSFRGSITLNENETDVVRQTPHFCKADHALNIVSEAIDTYKERVCTEFSSVRVIYEDYVDHLKGLDSEYVDDVPHYESVKNMLYNARYKQLGIIKSTYKN